MALTKIPGNLIETGAITGDVLADGGIATAKLANDAVTTDKILDTNITHAKLHTSMDLTGKTVTVATAAGSTNTTAAASTAFVQQELTTLIGGAPGTLDTLNELAAAINDDANYNSTLTTALATKLPLAGGTMTGPITMSQSGALHNQFTSTGSSSKISIISADGEQAYINYSGATNEMSAGYDRTSSSFRFTNADTLSSSIRMQINSAGNVIVGSGGTTTYNAALQVAGDITTTVDGNAYQLYYTESRDFITHSGATAVIKQIDNDTNNAKINFNAWDNSTIMTVMNSGNVGIGTASPSALLHLKSTTASVGPSLIFENTNNAQSMNIDYWNNGGALQSRIAYDEGPAAWNFIPNVSTSASALYIAYNGNVGIGETVPPESPDLT